MNRKLLLKSFGINIVLVIIGTILAVMLARRAENVGDLVFISVMMYLAGIFFLVNLIIAIIQGLRAKMWVEHAVMALASVLMLGIAFFAITAF
jgi:hypothetical protein